MWLTGRLAPDFKTIADFRHHNGAGIRNVCKRFIGLCRELKLFSQAIVAIDGSKFKAVNSRDRNFTPGKIEARQRQIEQSIQRYLDALETADRTQPADVAAKTERLTDKIQKLREQMRQLDQTQEQLKSEPDAQRSTTDPDARSMVSQAKGSGLVGYNVQAAVDAKHHLIVAHEVTNVGNDRAQLSPMARAARESMGTKKLQVFADRGIDALPDEDVGTCEHRDEPACAGLQPQAGDRHPGNERSDEDGAPCGGVSLFTQPNGRAKGSLRVKPLKAAITTNARL